MRGSGASTSKGRLIELEAVRGLASGVVLLHHLALAFLPRAKGPMPGGLMASPIAFLINGGAAVTLFFVLSGFVLTRRFFEQGTSYHGIAVATAKRLPRLMLPAGASLLLGYLILATGMSFHVEAGRLANSGWLAGFAGAQMPADVVPSRHVALWQWLSVFFQASAGEGLYNSNLWTMQRELFGSFFCFAAVGLLGALGRDDRRPALLLTIVTMSVALLLGEAVLPFLLGMLIARFHSGRFVFRGRAPALLLITAALLGLSSERFLFQLGGSCLLLLALLGCEASRQWLGTNWGAALGRLSFPLYLVHPAVICSVGSFLYLELALAGLPRWAMALAAMGATSALSVVAAVPFLLLDEWWVAQVNRIARAVSSMRPAAGRLQPAR